jgi:REase_DpnII-MboI
MTNPSGHETAKQRAIEQGVLLIENPPSRGLSFEDIAVVDWLQTTHEWIEKTFGNGSRFVKLIEHATLSRFNRTSSDIDQFLRASNQQLWLIQTTEQAIQDIRDVLYRAVKELVAFNGDEVPNAEVRQPTRDERAIDRVMRLLERFPMVVRQLQSRHGDTARDATPRPRHTVEDEYDVQDLVHALLKIDFDDVRPEEFTPSSGGASSRMDFLLRDDTIVIETKKTRQGLDQRRAFEELVIDIARYAEHPRCRTLVCFIYDPEARIGNPAGLIRDLEARSTDRLQVLVQVSPRGH